MKKLDSGWNQLEMVKEKLIKEKNMVNPQITDSVTQIIRYKNVGKEPRPSKIQFKFLESMFYDEAVSKYSDQSTLHIPSIAECDILHNYLRNYFVGKNFLTTELRDENTVTVANIENRYYLGEPRNQVYPTVITKIEFERLFVSTSLFWSENKEGDFATAWNEAYEKKKDGWRIPSIEELQSAAENKISGFSNDRYYWSNDWHGDPSHAGVVQMYSGAYFIGMPLYNVCNYRLVRDL